ncbi:porin family protein [Pedobacter sp. JY14-1]|uniref:porin family protein n=1 Tax=Pedobacter sp. JY14-1 TaxID=3034151 RepID=UPI0023E10D1B|nr:porin family protein [Pedobacter sp. JY14-1]
MMKKLSLGLLLAGFSLLAAAQGPVKFSLRAGLNFPTYTHSAEPGIAVSDIGRNISAYAGVTADIPAGGLISVQPGIIFSGKGYKDKASFNHDGTKGSAMVKDDIIYAEIPLNLIANLPAGKNTVCLGAGPYVGIALYGRTKYKNSVYGSQQQPAESGDYEVDFGSDGVYRRIDAGLNLTVGMRFPSGVGIQAGYDLGLSPINRDDDLIKYKHSVISLGMTIGI